jgi:hypothetical protein
MPCVGYLDLIHKGLANVSLPYYPYYLCKFGIFVAYFRHLIYSIV